jgi:hypothetical protein
MSPSKFPSLHSLVQPPFFAAPDGGGMPLFNEIFVFYWFNAFLKFSNMFEVFAALNGQSYKSILERMHPTTDGSGNPSQDPVINEHTIAYLHLCVICSLDAGVSLKRQKIQMYENYVNALTVLNGKEGMRDWRKELAETLTQWHDTFKTVRKSMRDPTARIVPSCVLGKSAVDESFL